MLAELHLFAKASIADTALDGVIVQDMFVKFSSFIKDLFADVTPEQVGTFSVMHKVCFVGKL